MDAPEAVCALEGFEKADGGHLGNGYAWGGYLAAAELRSEY